MAVFPTSTLSNPPPPALPHSSSIQQLQLQSQQAMPQSPAQSLAQKLKSVTLTASPAPATSGPEANQAPDTPSDSQKAKIREKVLRELLALDEVSALASDSLASQQSPILQVTSQGEGGSEDDNLVLRDLDENIHELQEDERVKEAIEKGLDLRAHSEALEEQLSKVEEELVQDYFAREPELYDLERKISACNSVLERMTNLLGGFQSDLAKVTAEIRTLHEANNALTLQWRNIAATKAQVTNSVDAFLVTPDMIRIVCNGDTKDVNDSFVSAVVAISSKMTYVKSNKESNIRAFKDIGQELERLRHKCAERIRDFFLEKFRTLLKHASSNLQMVQANVLLKYAPLNSFVMLWHPDVAVELRHHYINAAAKHYSSLFEKYIRASARRINHLVEKSDLLAAPDENSAPRELGLLAFLKSASSSSSFDHHASTASGSNASTSSSIAGNVIGVAHSSTGSNSNNSGNTKGHGANSTSSNISPSNTFSTGNSGGLSPSTSAALMNNENAAAAGNKGASSSTSSIYTLHDRISVLSGDTISPNAITQQIAAAVVATATNGSAADSLNNTLDSRTSASTLNHTAEKQFNILEDSPVAISASAAAAAAVAAAAAASISLPAIGTEDQEIKILIEQAFRLLSRVLVDACSAEYAFCLSFFYNVRKSLGPPTVIAHAAFQQILEPALKAVASAVDSWLSSSFDTVGVALCYRVHELNCHMLKVRGVALASVAAFMRVLQNSVFERYVALIDAHIVSVRKAKVHSKDMLPHCIVRRYTELCVSVISLECTELQPVLMGLRHSVDEFLARLAKHLPGKRAAAVALVNNYDTATNLLEEAVRTSQSYRTSLVNQSLQKMSPPTSNIWAGSSPANPGVHVPPALTTELAHWQKLLHHSSLDYIEDVLQPDFGYLIDYVQHAETDVTGSIANDTSKIEQVGSRFTQNWQTHLSTLSSQVVKTFANLRCGNRVLQLLLNQIVVFWQRYHVLLDKRVAAAKNAVQITGTSSPPKPPVSFRVPPLGVQNLVVEIKKFRSAF